mgnify:CR=1 FL=1
MKEIQELKSWVERYEKARDAIEDTSVLLELHKEGDASEEDVDARYNEALQLIEDLELRNMLRREEDKMGAILKINAGAGGTESQDWAEMLFRMYTRWAQKEDFEVSTIEYQVGDVAGIKSATIQVSGSYAYGQLKSESGVHRLVRISPFDSSGRRHTSFVAVDVVPELEDDIE